MNTWALRIHLSLIGLFGGLVYVAFGNFGISAMSMLWLLIALHREIYFGSKIIQTQAPPVMRIDRFSNKTQ